MDLKLSFPPTRNKKPTHVFMDGGTLHVPPDKSSFFNRTYIQSVLDRTQKICLVESCNPSNFVYFLDLDYKDTEALDRTNVENISIQISKILNIGSSIVLVAHPRELPGGLIKSGIHIVWKGKHVGINEALQLRTKLINEMGVEKWEPIIDKSVYRGGLRLPWSWKHDKNGDYKLPYLPIHIVNSDHTLRPIDSKPDETLLKLSSIIVPDQKREGWFSREEMTNEIKDRTIYSTLETFINYNIPKQNNTKIKNIWKQGDTSYWLVNTNSRYCENKGSCHGSNHIYFVIDALGKIYQKCHCKCDHIERKFGVCSSFRSKKYKLPGTVFRELFPDR